MMSEPPHKYIKEGLDGAPRHGPRLEPVPPTAASGFLRTEQGKFAAVAVAGDGKPFLQPLHGLWVQWRAPLLPAFSPDLQNLVPAGLLVIHHAQPRQFSDTATRVREHREKRTIPDADRRRGVGRVDQPAAIFRRQPDRFSVTRHR